MNIYLSGSISAGRQKLHSYIRIKEIVETLGHRITSPQTADSRVTDSGGGEPDDPRLIYNRDMKQLSESQIMIAEITIPSLGVGYEIATALHSNIPVLCLYAIDSRSKRISAMIAGNSSPLLTLKGYKEPELESILQHQLESYQLYFFDDV